MVSEMLVCYPHDVGSFWKQSMAVHAWNPSSWDVEAGGLRVQGHSWLQSKASLGYMWLSQILFCPLIFFWIYKYEPWKIFFYLFGVCYIIVLDLEISEILQVARNSFVLKGHLTEGLMPWITITYNYL